MKNIKEFFKKWKKGIMQSTPRQLLHAKIRGLQGVILGIFIGGGYLIYSGAWAFSVMLFFILFLQVTELIKAKQEHKELIEIETLVEAELTNKLKGG